MLTAMGCRTFICAIQVRWIGNKEQTSVHKHGDLTLSTETAARWALQIQGIQPRLVFCDYDRDGDLDVFVSIIIIKIAGISMQPM